MFFLSVTDVGTPTEPVSLTEAKDQLHISFTDDDTWLTSEIKSARQSLEKFTGLSLVPKTVVWHGSNAQGYSELPYGPVVSITTFTDGEDVTIAPADYKLSGVTGDFISIISPVYALLKVTYLAGYANAAAVPSALKSEIKRMVAWAFEHRGDEKDEVYQYSNKARDFRRVPVIL